MTPAQQLIAARERAGLSQAEAAAVVGMPRQHLNRWEKGHHIPRADLLAAVVARLLSLPAKRKSRARACRTA